MFRDALNTKTYKGLISLSKEPDTITAPVNESIEKGTMKERIYIAALQYPCRRNIGSDTYVRILDEM